MKTALITGSGGLVGSESTIFFSEKGFRVLGIDNNMRRTFFGQEGDTGWCIDNLKKKLPGYVHIDADIRDEKTMAAVFREFGKDIRVIIHTAAQPSHEWAAISPVTDFSVNATGTLVLLEMTRKYCPEAVFIFTSSNKVYGDAPNSLPFVEEETRFAIHPDHPYAANGIDENLQVDRSTHSIFGASKLAADVLVQEYGRYFGMKTVCFRCGCLTGPNHSGVMLHGFLAYLMKCAIDHESYTIFGYRGKQVRDNLLARDLVGMFWEVCKHPCQGEVYNAGGGMQASCSVLEAVAAANERTGGQMQIEYKEEARTADHKWWITDMTRFQRDYPNWQPAATMEDIYNNLYAGLVLRNTTKRKT